MHLLQPLLFLLLLTTARSLVLDECPLCRACPLRNPDINARCVDMTAVLALQPPTDPRRPLNFLTLIGDLGGTVLSGVVLVPFIDLSLLTSSLLQHLGVRQATIDKLEPFLHPEVRGRAAEKLLLEDMDPYDRFDRLLSEAEGLEFRTAITKYKLKQVEAHYNMAVDNGGPCFHDLRNSQRSVLLAALWAQKVTINHPVIIKAAKQDWDRVAAFAQYIVNRVQLNNRFDYASFMADDGKDAIDACLPFDTPNANCSVKATRVGVRIGGVSSHTTEYLSAEECIQRCEATPACQAWAYLDGRVCFTVFEAAVYVPARGFVAGVCKQRLPGPRPMA